MLIIFEFTAFVSIFVENLFLNIFVVFWFTIYIIYDFIYVYKLRKTNLIKKNKALYIYYIFNSNITAAIILLIYISVSLLSISNIFVLIIFIFLLIQTIISYVIKVKNKTFYEELRNLSV